MNFSKPWIAGAVLSSLLLSGCVSKVTDEKQFSGFLKNYDGLHQVTSPSGATVLRWVAKGFEPASFSTIVFEPLELYPAPKPSERVDLKTLQQLQVYTTQSAIDALSHDFLVVPSVQSVRQGERALVMRSAITGVTASNEGMKWYEVVPVAAVVGATQAAIGRRDQHTELYIEADLLDARTGMPVAKVVRKVFGETLKNASQPITADDFKVAIQTMTSDLQQLLK